MRLIDADALKRKAQKLSVEAWKTNRVARVHNVLNQFIEWIDGAPTIDAESKWTPVSERPPEVGQYVLISVRSLKDMNYIATAIFKGGYWESTFDLDWEEVLAWMPSPKPYEVEK